ncbi:hypothetical protein B0H13DRAFT_1921409 [Mycena leptocephala]|nr:hypothetical protein B0H13DRAFT_1921409 [Mycena leptocephala]
MLDQWDSGGMESRDESRAERIRKAGDMKRTLGAKTNASDLTWVKGIRATKKPFAWVPIWFHPIWIESAMGRKWEGERGRKRASKRKGNGRRGKQEYEQGEGVKGNRRGQCEEGMGRVGRGERKGRQRVAVGRMRERWCECQLECECEWEGLETCEMESCGETRSMPLGAESGYRGASILGYWVRWNWLYACVEGEEAHCLRSDAMQGWCCVHRYSVVSVGDIKAVGIVVDSVEQVELVIRHSHCLTRYGTVTKTVPVVQLLAQSLQPTIPLSFPLVPDTIANVTRPQQLWPMTLDHQSQCQRVILTHTSEYEQNCRLHPTEQIEGFLKLDPLWGGVLHRAVPN